MIAYSRDYPDIVYDIVVTRIVNTRSIMLSCLVGSFTSWVSPCSSMILSSRSELKEQFVGSKSFHLRSGALKSPAIVCVKPIA